MNPTSLQAPLEPRTLADDQENSQHPPVSAPPVFVVGVWRCGATLLYLLLNQHPDIRLFFECDLPVLWPMFRLPWARKKWVEKWEYWNASISRHDLDPVRLNVPVTSMADALTVAGREYAGQKGKKIWGCKSPSYHDRLDYLARQFPGARFIVVWRDPEEICRSVINAAAHSGPSGFWFARSGTIHQSVLASTTLKKQVGKLLRMGASVHQIHYRDLVGDTTGTMRVVCEFLQVPYDPAITVLDRTVDSSAVFEGAHHSLARGNNIVASNDRHSALPDELAAKIDRYQALWKAEAGDHWLLSERFSETGAVHPSRWEQTKDRLLFMLLRAREIAPRIAFSILPTAAWRLYRRLKYKDERWIHRWLANK
ncbi:MAG: sulfotransferase [Candidatus Sulfotelmatobacter sp.]